MMHMINSRQCNNDLFMHKTVHGIFTLQIRNVRHQRVGYFELCQQQQLRRIRERKNGNT